jgi:protein-tyrosine phosphatase
MIDLHSHILPGLDDGAETMESSLEMARAALADGIGTMAATPHVRDDFPTAVEEMERLVALLRQRLREASIPLQLLPGGEIALDHLPLLDDETLYRFGLGGNPRYLLIETPYLGWPLGIDETFFQLRLRGFSIVLAHPERNADVQADPSRLESLVEAGTLVQVTGASVDGRLGPPTRKTAERLLKLGYVHMLATDAHDPALREVGLASASRAIDDGNLVRWLTRDVPAAIVSDAPLPRRPEKPPRRFGFRRREPDE